MAKRKAFFVEELTWGDDEGWNVKATHNVRADEADQAVDTSAVEHWNVRVGHAELTDTYTAEAELDASEDELDVNVERMLAYAEARSRIGYSLYSTANQIGKNMAVLLSDEACTEAEAEREAERARKAAEKAKAKEEAEKAEEAGEEDES